MCRHRAVALPLLALLVTVALLAFGVMTPRPRRGAAIWFWQAWIVPIAGMHLIPLARNPNDPFSMRQRRRERRRR